MSGGSTQTGDSASRADVLWTWPDLCGAVGLDPVDGPAVSRVVTDSRLCQPGDLFVALRGDPGARFNPSKRSVVDGHHYLAAAAEAGAVGALVERHVSTVDLPQLVTADTYDALWQLAGSARSRYAGTVIAVTGSSGKTTTKTFLAAALDAYAAPGSYNNHIGVPLTLINLPPAAAAVVVEIGTNHPGEIEPLARLTAPHWAVVLNVQSAHLENFADRNALREEKLSIFKGLRDKSNAISHDLLALDTGHSFGESDAADARLLGMIDLARCRLSLAGEEYEATVPGGGVHRALAVTVTALLSQLVNGSVAPALSLPQTLLPAGRGNLREVGGVTIVDESYNANPSSMTAALETFLADVPPSGRRVGVIGAMGELGALATSAHEALAPLLMRLDAAYCVGEDLQAVAQAHGLPWAPAADENFTAGVADALAAGDRVLVKGSNGVFWQRGFVDALARAVES